jgi:hypothetical protein
MAVLSDQYREYPDYPTQEPIFEPSESQSNSEPKDIKKYLYGAIGLVVIIIIAIVFFSSGEPAGFGDSERAGCGFGKNCFEHPDECGCGEGYVCNNVGGRWSCVKSELEAEEPYPEYKATPTETPPDPDKKSAYPDGVCNEGENCFNHPKDCKCLPGEYCSTEHKKCIEMVCGDGICAPYEFPETCCIDCPCPSEDMFCNEESKSCEYYKMPFSCEEAIFLARNFYEGRGLIADKAECLGIYPHHEGGIIQEVRINIRGETFMGELYYRYVGVDSDGEVFELLGL